MHIRQLTGSARLESRPYEALSVNTYSNNGHGEQLTFTGLTHGPDGDRADAVVWPAGTPHKWWNAGTTELRMTGGSATTDAHHLDGTTRGISLAATTGRVLPTSRDGLKPPIGSARGAPRFATASQGMLPPCRQALESWSLAQGPDFWLSASCSIAQNL